MIDSRGYKDPDVGSFVSLPNGDELEVGSMLCPEKGNAMTDYEEVWRELPVPSGPQVAWILQSMDPKVTTFLGRVARYFLAFQQSEGRPFSARREDLNPDENKWVVKYSIGDATMPSIQWCQELSNGAERDWSVGNVVVIAGEQYRVLAIEASSAVR